MRGDVLGLGEDIELDIISPASNKPDPQIKNKKNVSLNFYSVITKLRYGRFSALLTGDAGREIEDLIAGYAGDIDVLKVPHHGSKTGMSDYFLSIVKPELAVISVGAKNRYKHPAKISLDLLESHNVKILQTDQLGDVEILSDGLTYKIKSSK